MVGGKVVFPCSVDSYAGGTRCIAAMPQQAHHVSVFAATHARGLGINVL
jgi:hypothetical protein